MRDDSPRTPRSPRHEYDLWIEARIREASASTDPDRPSAEPLRMPAFRTWLRRRER